MDEVNVEKDLKNFLYCSSVFEEKVARAYEHIANLVEDKFIRYLLSFIARDSFKHAECFKAVGEWLSGSFEVCFSECEKVWGETWKALIADAEKFLKRSKIGADELSSLISGLMKLENFAAEEYLTVMHIRLIKLIANEAKMGINSFKTILEWIIEDEKRHEQILKMIGDMLKKPTK